MSRLKPYGDCAFSVATPTLWNRLPANIRNAFKSDTPVQGRFHRKIMIIFKISYTVFTDIVFGVLLYYILFVQRL